LSTKKLFIDQEKLLVDAGIRLITYDAIQIELVAVDFLGDIKNVIFTSKNAVRAIQDIVLPKKANGWSIQYCFCVGKNTQKLLEEHGQKVVETASNASDLAKIISKKYKNEQFLFLCGNLRRDELPLILKEKNMKLEEKVVYKTHWNSKRFDRIFDGILFFSPSGVQSYVSENDMGQSIAFCIGNTTASEAKKHTNNSIVANEPTVENVIMEAITHFKNNTPHGI